MSGGGRGGGQGVKLDLFRMTYSVRIGERKQDTRERAGGGRGKGCNDIIVMHDRSLSYNRGGEA